MESQKCHQVDEVLGVDQVFACGAVFTIVLHWAQKTQVIDQVDTNMTLLALAVE